MVAQLLGFGVQPDLTGLNSLTMIGRSSGRVSAKSVAEMSKIGEDVGREEVLVMPERDEHGQSVAPAGKPHGLARDATAVESGPRRDGHQVESRCPRQGRIGGRGQERLSD